MVVRKGYICKWERDVPPNDNRNIYHFCSQPNDAAYWPSRQNAEVECIELNRGVTIPSGGTHVCRNFQVEEFAPDKFLIYCEAPTFPEPIEN